MTVNVSYKSYIFFLLHLQIYTKFVILQCVFHSIRFKVNKVGVRRYSFFYAFF